MAKVQASLAKAAMGSLLAGSMLLGSVPANAQYRDGRYDRRGDGISAGEVIAGAVVIGGLAAILSSAGRNDRYDDRYDRGGRYDGRYGYDYNRNGGSRQAIQQCVNAAEREASYRTGRADVTQITSIRRTSDGYQVEGEIAVGNRYGQYDRYDHRYNDRYNDRYGNRYDDRYGNRYAANMGRFSCSVAYGRVDGLRLRGIG